MKHDYKQLMEFYIAPTEREDVLEYEYIPENEEQFIAFMNTAPNSILEGLGFVKWESINNIILENQERLTAPQPVSMAYRKASGGYGEIDIPLHKELPLELLAVDEDLWLIPGEWYSIIPNGFVMTGLLGQSYPFEKGKSNNATRFGCLPYGIRRSQ